MSKFYNFLALIIVLTCFTACKTTEEVRREQMLDSFQTQLGQNQKLTAGATVKAQALEEMVAQLNGKLEQTQHDNDVKLNSETSKLKQEMAVLTEKQNASSQEIKNLSAEIEEQKKYIEQVVQSLSKISSDGKGKKGKKSDFDEAMELYNANKFSEARPLLQKLVDDEGLKADKKVKILHALGVVEFSKKKYESSLQHLSKVVTDFPKSSLNASALLHLAKVFLALKQNDNAKEALKTLIEKHSESKHIKKAKEMLEAL